jgi:hypothetical protein
MCGSNLRQAQAVTALDWLRGGMALAQRIALAALAIFLMLNAVTPFITPDPAWLAISTRYRDHGVSAGVRLLAHVRQANTGCAVY